MKPHRTIANRPMMLPLDGFALPLDGLHGLDGVFSSCFTGSILPASAPAVSMSGSHPDESVDHATETLERLFAGLEPFRQRGHEVAPPVLHGDGEHGNGERAHAQTQDEQDASAPLPLLVVVLLEASAFTVRLDVDLFCDALAHRLSFVFEFRPVVSEPDFAGFEHGFADEDEVTTLFPFGAGAFSPLGLLEQSAGLVEFGELFPERLIRR